jgi:hypothetical protein
VASAGTILISHTARSPLARSPSALISQITADGSKDFGRLALDMSPKPPTPHVVDEGGNDLGNFPTTIELALQPGEVAHRFLGGAKSTDCGKRKFTWSKLNSFPWKNFARAPGVPAKNEYAHDLRYPAALPTRSFDGVETSSD